MQTKVVITIDTEVKYPRISDPFDRDVLGNIAGSSYGAPWIADLLRRYGLTGVFFLDVYGSAIYGEARYRELCDRVLRHGHSIQLHTHPDQMYDPKRRHMHEYTLVDQTRIVAEGMALVKNWTGKFPIAHRAGRYGANEDTLKALHANGIHLDSSFFYGRADCRLPFPNSNAPFESNGVWEIPVTVASQPIEKLGRQFPYWTRRFWWRCQKLDVNCMPAPQLCRSLLGLCGEVPYIVTFLHSFSFVRRTVAGFVTDDQAIASFQSLLQLLDEKTIPVVTFEQVAVELAGKRDLA